MKVEEFDRLYALRMKMHVFEEAIEKARTLHAPVLASRMWEKPISVCVPHDIQDEYVQKIVSWAQEKLAELNKEFEAIEVTIK